MQTIAYKPMGQAYALSVTASQHADVLIKSNRQEPCNFAAFINTGSVDVAISYSPNGIATPAITFPVDGTPSGNTSFVLHANSVGQPVVINVPNGSKVGEGFNVSAIGSAAGPTVIYVIPLGTL